MEGAGRVAFVTGITGQDGYFLTRLLLEKGYKVHGLTRWTHNPEADKLGAFKSNPNLVLHVGAVTDLPRLQGILTQIKAAEPSVLEVYNLAAQSSVGASFKLPLATAETNAMGALNVLEAIKLVGLEGKARYLQAGTSEVFGKAAPPQTEATPIGPGNMYGNSKAFAYWTTRFYREAYGFFAASAILFNHESELRSQSFVTRKITAGAARIAKGDPAPLELGNMDARRDWGHAEDYVRAMWLILQEESPDDFVVATGEEHSVKEFVETAFEAAGLPICWEGEGLDEVARTVATGKVVVRINPQFFRPAEMDITRGDASKLHERTGWAPTINFRELIRRMVQHDLDLPELQAEVANNVLSTKNAAAAGNSISIVATSCRVPQK